MIPLSVLAVPLSLVPRHSLGRGGHIHLILHGHTPRPGYREREACATGLGIGRFSGQSGLRLRPSSKRPVAIGTHLGHRWSSEHSQRKPSKVIKGARRPHLQRALR